jgi:hypothetical protein
LDDLVGFAIGDNLVKQQLVLGPEVRAKTVVQDLLHLS